MGVDLCRDYRSKRSERRGCEYAGIGDTHNDLRSAASLLSGAGPFSIAGSESDPNLVRYGHADGQSVVDPELLDRERALPIKDLK